MLVYVHIVHIDTLRVSVNTGGGASRIWAGVIQISTVIDLILGL